LIKYKTYDIAVLPSHLSILANFSYLDNFMTARLFF